jgi:hypothetical protein
VKREECGGVAGRCDEVAPTPLRHRSAVIVSGGGGT